MAIGRETKGNYSNAGTDWESLQPDNKGVLDWYKSANCIGVDPKTFDVENGDIKAARAICRLCVVRTACFDEAVATQDSHTVRAGFTPKEITRFMGALKGLPATDEKIQRFDKYVDKKARPSKRA